MTDERSTTDGVPEVISSERTVDTTVAAPCDPVATDPMWAIGAPDDI
jgi:hypothetical protein